MVGVVCGRIGAWKSSKNISKFRLNFGRNLGSNSQALTLRDFIDFAGARLTYMRTFERKGERIELLYTVESTIRVYLESFMAPNLYNT